MRTIALLLAICAACVLSANFGTTARAQTPAAATPGTSLKAAACVETDRMMDWREITCAVPAGASPRRFSLFGEDGQVSVFCQFDRSAIPAAGAKLKVLIKWSHAEFADYEFSAE